MKLIKKWMMWLCIGSIVGIINPIPARAVRYQETRNSTWIVKKNDLYTKQSGRNKTWIKVGKSWYSENLQGIMQADWNTNNNEEYYLKRNLKITREKIRKSKKIYDKFHPFHSSLFDLAEFNKEFLNLINHERVKNGIHPLNYYFSLQKGVDERVFEMGSAGSISHTRPNGENFSTAFDYLRFHTQLFYLGENVATRPLELSIKNDIKNKKITLEEKLAKDFYYQYYFSPGHYANMIDEKFTGFSVGLQQINTQLYNAMILSG